MKDKAFCWHSVLGRVLKFYQTIFFKFLCHWWANERERSICSLIWGFSFFLGFTRGCWLCFQKVFMSVLPHILFLFICFCFQPPFTVIHGCVLALSQVHQKQRQPAGRSECFRALMRPECAWSMSTVGLTAQEISFPIEDPFLRGRYCLSMAGSKPSWNYRHELEKWVFSRQD